MLRAVFVKGLWVRIITPDTKVPTKSFLLFETFCRTEWEEPFSSARSWFGGPANFEKGDLGRGQTRKLRECSLTIPHNLRSSTKCPGLLGVLQFVTVSAAMLQEFFGNDLSRSTDVLR